MRKFKIDDHLGNYASGLRHLSAVNDVHFDAVVRYTQLHALYSLALDLYSSDAEKTKVRIRPSCRVIHQPYSFSSVFSQTLRNIQGDWLMETNKPFEAGLG
jgi:hypothetical protein